MAAHQSRAHLPGHVDAGVCLQRILDAAVRMPGAGAVGGWASARVHGIEECDPLPEADVREVDGLPFTAARRTTFDRVRRARDLREAVVAADQMTKHGLVVAR